jgi:hypothetical protein
MPLSFCSKDVNPWTLRELLVLIGAVFDDGMQHTEIKAVRE